MSLNIKNPEVERMARELSESTGESKTEAIRKALEERKTRLSFKISPSGKRARLMQLLEDEIWPLVPAQEVGRKLSRQEEESILGYDRDGV